MRINLRIFTTTLFASLVMLSIAQNQATQKHNDPFSGTVERCKSGILHEQLLQSDPQYAAKIKENEQTIQRLINSGTTNERSIYTIPVVVHVLHKGEAVGTGTNISTAQINSAIANMNQCYSGGGSYPLNIEVQFELAQRTPSCGSTTGIVRVDASAVSDYATSGITTANEVTIKAISKWPNSEYYNIWIVSEIDGNDGGGGTQGYAYFPGATSTKDGSVILYNSFGYDPTGALGYELKNYTNYNTTANHELGHAFNLHHTFNGDDGDNDGTADQCPANASCTADGDLCCDTEAHNRNDGNCGSTGASCSGGSLTNVVQNIMSYSSDACQIQFTADQKARMRAAISGSRASLLTSPALLAVSGSAPSISKSCSPQSTNLSNSFGMGVFGLTIGSTSYSSSGTVADGGFRNNWCANFSLNPNTAYAIEINNGTLNNEKVKAYIDYNNDGDFSDASEEVYSDNTGALTHAGNFTTIASPVTGQALWVRVISDFTNNTISGPCYVPQYGQVEDFSVTFTGGCTPPTADISGTNTICNGASTTFTASGGGTYSWNTGATTTAITISPSSNTTYTVTVTNGSGCTARATRAVTVNALPTASITGTSTICNGSSTTLTASGGGTYLWNTGASTQATTVSPSSNTNYTVTVTNASGCTARATQAVTVNATPTASITGTSTICNGSSTTLTASGGGSYLWNTNAATQATTVSPSSNTNYTVTVTNAAGCTAQATQAVSVNAAPGGSGSVTNVSCNGGNNGAINLTPSGGASYTFLWNPSGQTTEDRTGLTAGTYSVTITNGVTGCSGQTSFVVGTPAALTLNTVAQSSSCADNDGSMNLTVSGGTSAYTYSWSNGRTTEDISGLSQGSYTISVTDANGCTAQRVTNVIKACVPPTEVVTSQCGQTLPNLSSYFYCNAVLGAQDYEWEFTNAGLGYSYTKTNGNIYAKIAKTLITGLQYGNSYDVRVRAKVGGAWGNYGNTCTITISSSATQLISSQCGQTLPNLSGYFNCNAVAGAQDYEWEFTNTGLGYSFTRTSGTVYPKIARTAIIGLQYGNSYDVRVRVKAGGVWGNYSNTCTITIATPTTQLISTQCGQAIPNLLGYFNCNALAGAQDYEWEFTNVSLGYTYTKTSGTIYPRIARTLIAGLQYGNSYDVRVRAKVGGVWGNYGNTCIITIDPSATKVIASQCNSSLNLVGYFYCDAVAGAQDYEWEFTNAGLGYSYTRTSGLSAPKIVKTKIAGLQNGIVYNVKVRVKVGEAWGNYSATCTITINTGMITPDKGNDLERSLEAVTEIEHSAIVNANLLVFPNPSNNSGFNLSLEGMDDGICDIIIEVYDMYGKRVWSKNIENKEGDIIATINNDGSLANGVYLVNVRVNGQLLQQKVIVQ